MTIQEEIQNLIEELADDKISISKGLLKAKILNSKINHKELSKFIDCEMEGNYDDNTMPEYRLVMGESTFMFRNQYNGNKDVRKIPLPEATHFNGKSTNYRPITFGITEIEQAVFQTKSKDTYKVSFTPGQLKFAREYLQKAIEQNNGWELLDAYWSHSPTSFPEILSKVKHELLDKLIEIIKTFVGQNQEEIIYNENTHFDASIEVVEIFKNAKNKIILIDGYVDSTTLKLLSSKKEKVKVQILTDPKALNDYLEVLTEKFNRQYKNLEIRTSKVFHDRFLIVDDINYYQIGASLKDMGNKTSSFVRFKEEFIKEALMSKFNKEWKR